MRLADFILANVEPILVEWEIFAQSICTGEQDKRTLRDHAAAILEATAIDMQTAQSADEREKKSKGERHGDEDSDALDGASVLHAVDRLGLGFDMLEVISEYRALRASVLKLWKDSSPSADERDVDDLTRFNESIDQSLAKAVASYAKRVDQARDMFLAILGHDLRNPLHSIAMTAQLVPQIINNPVEARECSKLITGSVSVMARMISDLLDYTRTRLGAGMPVKPMPMNLRTLGMELLTEFRTAYPARDIQFCPAGDLHGAWDSDRVRQAISNLLGNAMQHGSESLPITLALRGEGSNVLIEVHSGGEPIPPKELAKIFDPLVRGMSTEDSLSDRPGSIGMGLYIAREVAKAHHGRIDVTSSASGGTTFTITLPRIAASRIGEPSVEAEHVGKK